MNSQSQKAKEIFLELISNVPPEEWEDRLVEASAGDQELLVRVKALLRAHVEPGSFLEEPAIAEQNSETRVQSITEQAGDSIGPYKLLQQIGEGGMGVVYMAEQTEPVKRRVALKVIKPGMDTRKVIARFEAERQALAMMDHPNIAKVLDAGTTTTGRPYFVMELVKGVPITQYCDEKQLTPRERLELFVPVCQALQHAHQKGIIHRDIKPSNVLVARYDDRPVPKIIDFGVAKAVEQRLTEKTMFTEFGQVVGTIEYMSPEQAELNQLDIDTRTDVYSLGVLLYELLTGETPFDREKLRSAAFDEMLRIIREEEPLRPSLKLSTSVSLPSIAANRHVEPKKLSALMHGELDWIVMKALEKDRTRRYETASKFAEDVLHYLHDEPVHACPPSNWYKLGKFAKRNKMAIGGMAAILTALAAGVIVSTSLYLQAENARGKEAEQRKIAEAAQQKEQQQRLAADIARGEAILRATIARQQMMTMKAQSLAKTYPHEALLILREFPADIDPKTATSALNIAHAALQTAPFITEQRFLQHTGTVRQAAWSPDGKRIVTASEDGTARVWNINGTGESILLAGHTDTVWDAAWSPDGQRIVTASSDGTARVWNADGTEEPIVLAGHQGSVGSAAWSPDGQRIVTASSDGTARVWNADGTGEAMVLAGHADTVRLATWSPDGSRILTTSFDHTARVWNADGTGEPIVLTGHQEKVFGGAWSPDGQRIATASWDKTTRIWNADGIGKPIILHGRTTWVEWSPDGRHLVTTSSADDVQVWNADGSGEPIAFVGHAEKEYVHNAAWSPDGKRIVTASSDGTARVWNADGTGHAIVLAGHGAGVTHAAWSPDGKRIVTTSSDHTARVWNVEGGSSPVVLAGHQEQVIHAEWDPDGNRIVTASRDNTVRVWNANGTGEPIVLRGHTDTIWFASWSPDGQRIVTASRDETARIWNADGTGEPIILSGHSKGVRHAVWSPDGSRIVTASADRTGRVWNADGSGNPIVLTGASRAAWHAGWSPDGRQVVTAHMEDSPRVWNADGTGEPIIFASHTGETNYYAAWSPDGNRIVTTCPDHTAQVWNANGTGEPIVFAGHKDRVGRVVWSPDGSRIVSTSWDRTARVWKANGNGEPIILAGHKDKVCQAAWSYDGNRIATSSLDNTLRIWNADGTGEPIILASHPGERQYYIAWSPDGKRIVTASEEGTLFVWSIKSWPEMRASLWNRIHHELTPKERIQYLGETPEEAGAEVTKTLD